MPGNANLNSLMSMFSGLGAGGGLGVPTAPSGQYPFLYFDNKKDICHSLTLSMNLAHLFNFRFLSATGGAFRDAASSAPRDGVLRHTGEHPSADSHLWERACRGGATPWESWAIDQKAMSC